MKWRTNLLLVLAGAGVVAWWILVPAGPSLPEPNSAPKPALPAGSRSAPAAAPAATPGNVDRARPGTGGTPDPGVASAAPDGQDLRNPAGPASAGPTGPEGGLTVFHALAESGADLPEPIVSEPLARNALRLVGKDPAAEVVWERAINDPGLPRGARSDLIEDLNDEGFPDRKDLTAADIPLILARLRLIERLSPYAMDDVNTAAFAEAYKDLLAMLARLRGTAAR